MSETGSVHFHVAAAVAAVPARGVVGPLTPGVRVFPLPLQSVLQCIKMKHTIAGTERNEWFCNARENLTEPSFAQVKKAPQISPFSVSFPSAS